MDIREYISTVSQKFRAGNATEHSYRGALELLMQSLLPTLRIVNEPKREKCGAPDYIVSRRDGMPVFYIEAKDIGDADLDGRNKNAHKEQFDRYKQALGYIIFTDYLDFHLYEHGEFVDSVRIAEVKGDKIVGIAEAEDKFIGMIQHLGSSAIQRITSAPRLAKLMAGKARLLANIIGQAIASDQEKENRDDEEVADFFHAPQEEIFQTGLREQMETFQRVLLHDITPQSFADVYAQTIVYGLFAARLNDKTPEDFSRQEALNLIPKTSSFLRNLFQQIAGLDPDPRIEWIIDDLVTAFGATDMQKILKGYNEDTQRTDPMMHFYEDFLAAYDPSLRKAKGVWYTPQPVVKFIVRAVDEILQKEFGLEMGLADYSKVPRTVSVEQSYDKRTSDHKKHVSKDLFRVQILDPAMGTGTFISEIIRQVKSKFEGNEGIWSSYLSSYLLPRIYGFEVMVAPYTIAHMKTYLQLKEYGNFSDKDMPRMNLLLTNSLEEADEATGSLFAYWLSQEANRANIIKRDCPVMVMIGNPPYSISSQNNGKWITNLIADYKKDLNERNMQPLSDDYIKFIRLGQHYIEKNGEGILAFICNNSFVDGIIHRQMRSELLRAFDKIYILNLHGNARKHEKCPDGSDDDNVFDIMQGVSINIFVKSQHKRNQILADVYYSDLYGKREDKYSFLDKQCLTSVPWEKTELEAPNYSFRQQDNSLLIEYNNGIKLADLMPFGSSGITTSNDDLVVDFSRDALVEKLQSHGIENVDENEIYRVAYKAFDNRYYYLNEKYALRRRPALISNYKNNGGNYTFNLRRTAENTEGWYHIFLTDTPSDGNFHSARSYCYPLYLFRKNMGVEERIPNLDPKILKSIEDSLGEPVEPQELFDYIYAVLHSPAYRERYKEFLKIDFPRIPYPADASRYHTLAGKGAELRRLHLMEGLPNPTSVAFPVGGTLQVDCYRWQQNRVNINSEQYFEGVPQTVWDFYIGGYQPAQKWLKDRKGRTLSFEDVRHYQHIVYVIQQTGRIMQEIDSTLK